MALINRGTICTRCKEGGDLTWNLCLSENEFPNDLLLCMDLCAVLYFNFIIGIVWICHVLFICSFLKVC